MIKPKEHRCCSQARESLRYIEWPNPSHPPEWWLRCSRQSKGLRVEVDLHEVRFCPWCGEKLEASK